MANHLEPDLKELRDTFNSGKTKEYSWRISQLRGLLHILEDRENDIFLTLKKDLGKHHVEAYRDEVGTVVKSINYALGNLKQWMAAKKIKCQLAPSCIPQQCKFDS
ncbi:aldehyde dehydrogenase family 3 member F1-like protein [Tanacetum coccineum]